MLTALVHDVAFPSNNKALERLILVLARLVPGSSQFFNATLKRSGTLGRGG